MFSLCVIHNGEQERLDYLVPRLDALASTMQANGWSTTVHLFGPERVDPARLPHHNWWRRVQKARDFSQAVVGLQKETSHTKAHRSRTSWFKYSLREKRSLRAEQDALQKHVAAWRACAAQDETLLIFENDTIFKPTSEHELLDLLRRLSDGGALRQPAFVDLAGGIDIGGSPMGFALSNSNEMSLRATLVSEATRYVNNTACCYLMTAPATQTVIKEYDRTRPLLPADWALMSLSVTDPAVRAIRTFMTEPPIFSHGSFDGFYASVFE